MARRGEEGEVGELMRQERCRKGRSEEGVRVLV